MPPYRPPIAAEGRTRSTVAKHSLLIAGHPTSISLEAAFWHRLRHVAEARTMALAALVAEIDAARGAANLSSAIRVFLLEEAIGSDAASHGGMIGSDAASHGGTTPAEV